MEVIYFWFFLIFSNELISIENKEVEYVCYYKISDIKKLTSSCGKTHGLRSWITININQVMTFSK